jgi:hypothetical protein
MFERRAVFSTADIADSCRERKKAALYLDQLFVSSS